MDVNKTKINVLIFICLQILIPQQNTQDQSQNLLRNVHLARDIYVRAFISHQK